MGSGDFLQAVNVTAQFLFIGHAREVPTEHFIRTQGRLATGPQRDQHTGDNGRVGLQFDAVALVAQEMATPKNVLVEPKEDFNRPTVLEDQGNHVRIDLHQVRGDGQGLGLLRPAAAGVSAFAMWRAGHFYDTNRLGEVTALGIVAQSHDTVAYDARRLGLGERGFNRDALEDFEVDMVLDGLVLIVDPEGPGDLGQPLQERPVHGGEDAGQVVELVMGGNGLELRAELFDDLDHGLAVEDRRGLGQAAQGRPRDAELALDFLQFAGLLQGPQGRTDRIEHVQQEQRDVLIHVQASVARPVSFAADVVKRIEHSRDGLEILEALHFVLFDLMPFVTHARYFKQDARIAPA